MDTKLRRKHSLMGLRIIHDSASVAEDRLDTPSFLRIEGPLRFPVAAELRATIEAMVLRGTRNIVVSLSESTDLDAAGVGELVRAYNTTTDAGGTLRILAASRRTRGLLARVGLLDLLDQDSQSVRAAGSLDRRTAGGT
jgi:anti-anti-sigma factor